MKKVNMADHQFEPTTVLSPHDRGEYWWRSFRCKNCGIRGRRYSINEPFIYVTDSFSNKRVYKCIKDNFVDRYLGTQIQICCEIHGYKQIPIYSIHTVVTPPPQSLNGENGVWIKVKGLKEPVQILFDECVSYPIPERIKPVLKRTKKAGQPKVIPPYMKIKHVRTKAPIKFTRTRKPIKFKRTIKPIKRTRTR